MQVNGMLHMKMTHLLLAPIKKVQMLIVQEQIVKVRILIVMDQTIAARVLA